MRHFRHTGIFLLSVALTGTALTAASCDASGSKAILGELGRVVEGSSSKIGPHAKRIVTGEIAAAPTADDLGRSMAQAQTRLGEAASQAEAADLLRRAELLQNAIREAMSSAEAAATTRSSLAVEARQAAPAYATVRSVKDESTMGTLGDEVLHDLLCSATFDTLAPEEKSDVTEGPFTFAYLREKTPEAAAKTLFGLASGRVGAAFARGYKWGGYGAELFSDAGRHMKLLTGQITSPDLTISTAYIYFAKVCLKPPS